MSLRSILEFFKPKDGLPDPQGSLSRAISSEAIEMANREVENVHTKKVRGPYVVLLDAFDIHCLCLGTALRSEQK